MSSSYETCVYCIRLDDAGPDVQAHDRLRLVTAEGSAIEHTLHLCEICGTRWHFGPTTGWQRETRAA